MSPGPLPSPYRARPKRHARVDVEVLGYKARLEVGAGGWSGLRGARQWVVMVEPEGVEPREAAAGRSTRLAGGAAAIRLGTERHIRLPETAGELYTVATHANTNVILIQRLPAFALRTCTPYATCSCPGATGANLNWQIFCAASNS